MEDDQQDQPLEGAAAFLFMLLGNAAEARKKYNDAMEKFASPAVNVRLPMALIARLVDGVGCECDMCLGILMWAKSIDTSNLDDQLKRVLIIAIANAESRLLSEKQKAEYTRIYGHKS